MSTIFDKIIAGEIPCKKVYEDDDILAFHDIAPKAPVHILIIPKKSIPGVPSLQQEDDALMGRMIRIANQIADTFSLENGYRLVINSGTDGGQSVDHLHFHLLGGRSLTWPPG
ncbi:histidine triad nucleotide-binding protein [bacterium]|nr:histidine triad nucleotide-binding protein [bacterium]